MITDEAEHLTNGSDNDKIIKLLNEISDATVLSISNDNEDIYTMACHLRNIIGEKEPIFVCIGTDKVIFDSVGPIVGTALTKLGYQVIGALNDNVDMKTMKNKIALINSHYDKDKHIVIAVDACIGSEHSLGDITIGKTSCIPGSGMHKHETEFYTIGDASIKIITATTNLFMDEKKKPSIGSIILSASKVVDIITSAIPATAGTIVTNRNIDDYSVIDTIMVK